MYHEQNRPRVVDAEGETAGSETTLVGHPPGSFDPGELAARLRSRVLGQDAAIDAVVHSIVLARVGANDPSRPLANLLLVGPTGVGKTELVRRVAAELRSGPEDLCRVDMGSLALEHYAASFSGAPPGYAGSKESFSLFERSIIEGDPYTPGIMLFDEVEKAHPTVLRALLQVLDTGVLRLANGQQRISFRNCLVFLTSNLGSAELARRRGSIHRRLLDRAGDRLGADALGKRLARRNHSMVVENAVRSFFEPEFFNRIDETIVFRELDRELFERIARLEIELLCQRLRRRNVILEVDDQAAELLARRGFDPVYGARGMRRTVRTLLAATVAAEVVSVRPIGTEPLRVMATASADAITSKAQIV
jgi:ATP-dependent Clp protease ATP-binding subunit ClpA